MIDNFYRFILFFFEMHLVAPLLALGVNYANKRAFIYIALMAFLSAFINIYLKSIWQIPLDPSLNKLGWAYPSGHTHFNMVLWLMVLYYFRKLWLIAIVVVMFILSIFAMIHFHYHNWEDIQGGIIAGICTFLFFPIWDYFYKNKQLLFAIICLIVSICLFSMLPPPPLNYNWLYTYFGLFAGYIIYLSLAKTGNDCIGEKSIKNHKIEALFLLLGLYLIDYLSLTGSFLSFVEGLLMSLIILIIIPYISNYINYKGYLTKR